MLDQQDDYTMTGVDIGGKLWQMLLLVKSHRVLRLACPVEEWEVRETKGTTC